ncbi:MAG TPA: selenocysteine-specific translation elongation factor [Acetobacteraceae bacterium]|jgi:selenocysteine-specific elongation factor|nr:selenocysteine-specific translation elongation factor [Acetobacteraceae bacterium]
MIIGTAGHIDHGKTALVKALTGIDADRLAEEKRRGITIDLGYAYTDAFGFVDVPGHERFVHTMLAGASGVDAALLVVALNDGVMPQTREHVQILQLLGIDRGVVALTKSDLAPARDAEVASQVNALLQKTALASAPLLPVSVVTGAGIEALRAALLSLGPRQRDAELYPRLAIDRAFTLAGAGLVVTGTLVSGRIRVDDRLMLSPPGIELRVRGLHAQNRPAEQAAAGQRAALNVTGPRLSKDAVTRGDWVLHPAVHAPTTRFDVRLTLLAEESRALRADAPVHLHLGAAHVTARVAALDAERIEPGSTVLARLTLDRPIGALACDRLVLRDATATRTIGGGVVIDPFPPRRGRRAPERLAQLTALDQPDPADALRALLALAPGWTERVVYVRSRNLSPAVQQSVQAAAPAVAVADLLMAPTTLDALRDGVTQRLAVHHAAAPDQPGLQFERLRMTTPGRPSVAAFRAVIESLFRSGAVEQDGPWLRLATHRAILSVHDERVWQQARELIAAERFRPPRTRDLARALSVPEAAMRAALKRVHRMGRLIEVAPDQYFLSETVAEMAGIAAAIAEVGPAGTLTAAEFRDRLANGRKVAIQVLEFFDRAGVTVRVGDERRVRTDRLGMFGPAP